MKPLSSLVADLRALDVAMSRVERSGASLLADLPATQLPSACNLLQYLVLRRVDFRHAQRLLAQHGLSSLGRSESHVRDGLTAVRRALHVLEGAEWTEPVDRALTLEDGEALLRQHTDALFGSPSSGRNVRIMVTMPREAAFDYALVRDLVATGMDCMRINCAHDGPEEWGRMIDHLRRASTELGRPCAVSMDLAGPKLRTAGVSPGPAVQKIRPQRDAWGQVTAPASVALVPPGIEPGELGTDDIVRVDAPPPAACGPGSRLSFLDARGRSRILRVQARHDQLVIATLDRTAYLVPGTELRLKTPQGWDAIRVLDTPVPDAAIALHTGDRLVLTSQQTGGHPATRDGHDRVLVPAHIGVTLPQVFDDIVVGDRIWFDDGRMGGVIRQVERGRAIVEMTQVRPGGDRLLAGKGINLPDTALRLEPLTDKDIEDLAFVVRHADMVGYSFVRRARDVQRLREHLQALGGEHLGIVLKIETRLAFEELPRLLLAAMHTGRFGVMIARGDLAIECGYERMAEIQEEILWIAEAAHAPVVWATQVLETMAKTGVPSRAEVTDAAMAERAECVMLNKGPFVVDAVRTLDDILRRMQAHQTKKRSMLRPLSVAQSVLAEVIGADDTQGPSGPADGA